MTIVIVILAAYVALVGFVWLLVVAASRADDAIGRGPADALADGHHGGPAPAAGPPVRVLPHYERLGRLVADVAGALGARHVAVVVRDGVGATTGTVAASMTENDSVGRRIPVAADSGAAVGEDAAATAVGVDPADGRGVRWRVAQVPITRGGTVLGLIVVAARRQHGFTDRDMAFLRRLARRAAPELHRSGEAAKTRATA